MRSSVHDILPLRLRRALEKFGADIALARKKRGFTVAMMCERLGVAKSTYARVEKGDASVTLGVYAMTLFVLGFAEAFTTLAAPAQDDHGLLLDAERLPKRVRPKKDQRR